MAKYVCPGTELTLMPTKTSPPPDEEDMEGEISPQPAERLSSVPIRAFVVNKIFPTDLCKKKDPICQNQVVKLAGEGEKQKIVSEYGCRQYVEKI